MNKHARRDSTELKRAPKPRNPKELEILSMWYFCAPLHFSMLRVYPDVRGVSRGGCAQYEVAEPYNSYNGKKWLFGCADIDGYDYSAKFWRHVVGELYCGGIAAHSYGQAHIGTIKDCARLTRFANYLTCGKSGELGAAFKALAKAVTP